MESPKKAPAFTPGLKRAWEGGARLSFVRPAEYLAKTDCGQCDGVRISAALAHRNRAATIPNVEFFPLVILLMKGAGILQGLQQFLVSHFRFSRLAARYPESQHLS
jgi:hypothetical protein